MIVTVAICTWNRAELLDQTLSAMCKLRLPDGLSWELLIANNGCTDHTDTVIARHSVHLPIRRLLENRKGLSHARNAVLGAARGDLIVWTDDDVLVEPGWLAAYIDAAIAWPDAAFFGAPIRPWFVSPPPKWVVANLDLLGGPYALLDLGSEARILGPDEFPMGANMAYRTRLSGGARFDVDLGRIGDKLLSGEELEFMRRLRAQGLSGVWVPAAGLRHYVPTERLTARYIRNWYRGYGQSVVRSGSANCAKTILGVPRWAIRAYASARIRSILGWPMKGRLWLKGLERSAYLSGMIRESRRMQRLSAADHRAAGSIDRVGL